MTQGTKATVAALLTACSLTLPAPGCASPPAADAAAPAASAASAAAFDFELLDINPRSPSKGQRIRLRDLYAERGVVLEFTASWCAVCRSGLPEVQALATSGKAPVVFIAADEGGPADSLLIVAERAKLTLPILYVPEAEAAEFEKHYGYEVLPATYLIDRRGAIRKVFEGRVPRASLEAELERMIVR